MASVDDVSLIQNSDIAKWKIRVNGIGQGETVKGQRHFGSGKLLLGLF